MLVGLTLAVTLAACGGGSSTSSSISASTRTASTATASTSTASAQTSTSASKAVPVKFQLSSPAFRMGGKIPARYTCDGANVSPPLQWQKVPPGTVQLLLMVFELPQTPKGGTLWVVGNISPGTRGIAADAIPAGAVMGRNGKGTIKWGGICPAKGKPHSLVFVLYALRKKLAFSQGFDVSKIRPQLTAASISAGVAYGTYRR